MALESVLTARVPTKAAPPMPSALHGNSKSTADSKAADKDAQNFRHLLEGLDSAGNTPADGASSSKDADPADGGAGRRKLLNTGKSPASGNNSTGTADAATWIGAYLPPVPIPLATPLASAQTSASVPGTSDTPDALQGTGTVGALKADVAGGVGSATAHNAALPAALPDARTPSVNQANYASIFGQIQSRLAGGGTGAPDAMGSGTNGLAKPVLGTAAADTRADQMATMARGGLWVMPVTEAAALQAATDATAALKRAVGESGDKREGLLADKLPEGGVGQNPFTPTVHFESASASVNISQAAPEAAVADQVSYWVAQGIQNAELTFDGADAQPVQVSISLSGNEAHVEFRTDQLETRDLLTGAAAHLKDLLQSQGMVLSGLSVGSSGAGGTNARERRTPSEGRKITARSAPEVVAVRSTAPQGASGRAVDLFV